MTAKTKNTEVNPNTGDLNKISGEYIMSLYMNQVLEEGEQPRSVYKFTKDNGLNEQDFYRFYGSFEGLQEHIWVAFYTNTLKVLQKDKNYEQYPNEEKMLAFFFTFFELLTSNRSYVLFALSEHKDRMKRLKQLRRLRFKIKDFASDLIEQSNEQKNFKLTKNPVSVFSEGAWVQFLFLLKFWIEENSAGFEKTDVAIEKSVRAIFDVFETTPFESVIDFGKFILKDRFTHS